MGMSDPDMGSAVYPWPWPLIEEVRQYLCSYLGHFSKACSYRLLQDIKKRFIWLNEYFLWQDANKIVFRCPIPRAAFLFWQQKKYFQGRLPNHVVIMQRGKVWEIMDKGVEGTNQKTRQKVWPSSPACRSFFRIIVCGK